MIDLKLGDSLEVLKELKDNSVDSVVTDPPYELGFMGKKWDNTGIAYNPELWRQVLRVMKSGAHLISFGGTRTYHRMACAIEDAGFEIRDQLQWLYGSGFPKSHNIGKAVDKLQGNTRKVIGTYNSASKYDGANRIKHNGVTWDGYKSSNNIPITEPVSNESKKWDGWGSNLKPANEPICLARKPLSEKTIVENVLKWGTGGLNIDASRIGNQNIITQGGDKFKGKGIYGKYNTCTKSKHQGRFPANIILDEEAGRLLDEQSGILKTGKMVGTINNVQSEIIKDGLKPIYVNCKSSSGGASRFFYCAKSSKSERNKGLENIICTHPTVKPLKLMSYLVKLVTPPQGIVLDPFMGSGTTGISAKQEGFGFVGIEKEKEYLEIAKKRIFYEGEMIK